ncbi:MAG: hypothetical protein SGARI_007107, partial [Bacillariaceae sp.]
MPATSAAYGDDEQQFGNQAYEKKKNHEPTVAVIPAEDVLPMHEQEKLGGGAAVIWTDVAIVGLVTFFLVIQTGLDDQVELVYYDDVVSDRVNEIYAEYLPKLNIFGIWIPAFQIVWLLVVLVASCIILNNMYTELADVQNDVTDPNYIEPPLS